MKTIKEIKFKIADQKGASAVEFAIILPLLVIFLFGIIEFSILFYDKAVITNASREGARTGILFREARPDYTEVRDVVINYCGDKLITFGDSSTQCDVDPLTFVECENHNDQLTVNVTYQYEFLLIPGFLAAFFSGAHPGSINIDTETVMRCE
ncbi:MAG: pilus assembly protein [Desulfobacterales bacterium]|nr:MAG: pilus assembly protein [Desulfobacterales bacterium]